MNFDEYMCNIWQQTSLIVLCSSTVKEPVPVQLECTKQPFYYTMTIKEESGCLPG